MKVSDVHRDNVTNGRKTEAEIETKRAKSPGCNLALYHIF